MDLRSMTPWLALVGAVVVAALAFWWFRARARKVLPPPEPEPGSEDEDYLDSSHIISRPVTGLTADQRRDATARAAAALRGKNSPRD